MTQSVSTVYPAGILTGGVFPPYEHQGRLYLLGSPTSFLYSGEVPAAGPARCYVSAGARPDNPLQGQLLSNWCDEQLKK